MSINIHAFGSFISNINEVEAMNHVYLVYRDNGDEDPYDYYDWLASVHMSEESAREYILKTGIPRVKDAEFFDKEGDGKTITIYRSKRSLSIYDPEWVRGCNVTMRIERWEVFWVC